MELGKLGTWELGTLGTWELGRLVNWELGKLGTWELGTWELGSFRTWELGNLGRLMNNEAKIDVLKGTFKALFSIKEERKVLQNEVKYLKEEISSLNAAKGRLKKPIESVITIIPRRNPPPLF